MPVPSIRSGDTLIKRSQLLDHAAQAAGALARLGVMSGDRVALILKNNMAFVELSLAIAKLGAITVPVNWHFTVAEVDVLLKDCGAKCVFIQHDLTDRLSPQAAKTMAVIMVGDDTAPCPYTAWRRAAAPYAGPAHDAPSAMVYTSGTTGQPKGVRREPATPDQAAAMQAVRSHLYQMDASSRVLVPGPLYHALPNQFALHAIMVAEYTDIMPNFDAKTMLATIERERITTIALAPIMFVRLLRLSADIRSRYDLSSLKWAIHAGGPCPNDIKRAMIQWWGPIIAEYYGGTETGPLTLSTSAEWLDHPGSCGKPLPNVELRIVDAQKQDVPHGQSGEIYARLWSYPDFTYHNDPQKRADTALGDLISLGDIGFQDDDGFLFLQDRARDMVISGGVNIYPAEVENAIFAIDGVDDCAVFGVADPEFGESVAAFIVSKYDGNKNLDSDTVRSALRQAIAGYKIPRTIWMIDHIERDASGKIRKHLLPEIWRKLMQADTK